MKLNKIKQVKTRVELFSILAHHPEPYQHVVGDVPRRAAGYGSPREEALRAITALHPEGSKEAGFLPGLTKKTATEIKAETVLEQGRLEKALRTPEAQRTRTMKEKISQANQCGSPLHQALRNEFPSMLKGKAPLEINQWLTNRIMEDASWPEPYVKGIPTSDADNQVQVETTLDIPLAIGKTIGSYMQQLTDEYPQEGNPSLSFLIDVLEQQLIEMTDYPPENLTIYKKTLSALQEARADFEKKIICPVNTLKVVSVHEAAHSTSSYLAGYPTSVRLTHSPAIARKPRNQGWLCGLTSGITEETPDITSLLTPRIYLHASELPGDHGGEGLDMNKELEASCKSDSEQFRQQLGEPDSESQKAQVVAMQIRHPEFKKAVRDVARALFNKGHLSADETKAILDKHFKP
jgi:hypothetical protein